jgi:hypothetical protein
VFTVPLEKVRNEKVKNPKTGKGRKVVFNLNFASVGKNCKQSWKK